MGQVKDANEAILIGEGNRIGRTHALIGEEEDKKNSVSRGYNRIAARRRRGQEPVMKLSTQRRG